ncbi:MAG: ketoacyl-ACP synthase III [Planctomycetota bacterium]|nr:MAG: ketoacyl-ACP synthase III [Planctomycetota bacterium]
MSQLIPVGIAGLGHYVPEWVVENDYFTRFIDTSDEWIQQRTGIQQRRWLRDDQRPSDMFVEAGRMAMERAGVQPEEIDLIMIGTVSADYTCPTNACLVQEKLGCHNAAAFDMAAACAGFVYTMATGSQFIATGTYKNVLVMGGEALSRISDIYDRNSCVLFGDGAGAAVLQPHEVCKQGLLEGFKLAADGKGYHYIIREYGGGLKPVTPQVLVEGSHMLRMKGREVYRFAVAKMIEIMEWGLGDNDLDDVCLVIPHQMNLRIMETAREKLNIPKDKMEVNIHRYGNTSAASCAIGLSEAWAADKLESDKLILLAAFGSGLVWAGARIRW